MPTRLQPSPTKITAPHLPDGIVQRERLFHLLDKGRKKPVIWISGPGGSGKTTLVASYLEYRKIPCLWYQVDEGDGDVGSFFYYLGMAVTKARPADRKPLPLFSPEYSLGIPTFTRRFFEELSNRFHRPFVLVFDNFQDAPVETAFHDVLNIGSSIVPEGQTMIVLSRVDPPPSYAQLKAGRRMESLGWHQIRFSLEETKEIVKGSGGAYTDAQIEGLHRETDGWAAGLVLMLEKMRITGLPPQSGSPFPRDDIFDYFAGELFNKIPKEIKSFLLQTSVPPSVTPEMAERLTGSSRSREILFDLHRRNFFITRHVQEGGYQYHPLFREFLLARARDTLSAETIRDVRGKAAALLEDAARMEDAAQLFIQSADWEGLTGLILKNAQALLAAGRSRTLEAWQRSMPKDVLLKNSWLLYWMGSCLLMVNPAEARNHFEAAFELFTGEDDRSGLFLTWANIVDTFMYEWRDIHPLDHWIKELESLLRRYRDLGSREIEDRVTCCMFSALMFRQPHHPDLPGWQAKAEAVMNSTPDETLKVSIGNNLVYYHLWTGRADAAGVIVDSLSPLFKKAPAHSLAQLMWFSAEALYAVYTARYQRGLAAIIKGLTIAEATGIHLLDILFLGKGIYHSLATGDLKTAEAFLRKMEVGLEANSCFVNIYYHHMASLLAMHRADFPPAIRHAEISLTLSREAGFPFSVAIHQYALANILFWAGMPDDLPQRIEEIRAIGVAARSSTLELFCAVLEVLWAIGTAQNSGSIEQYLKAVFTLQKKTGFTSILYHGFKRTDLLCAKALEAGVDVEFVQELIRCHGLLPERKNACLENWPWLLKIRTFGHFEILMDGEPVAFSGKVQKKPLELLKALVAFGGENVAESRLAEALWPDADGDLALSSFNTTLYRLRKLLNNDRILKLTGSELSLDPRYCWTDAGTFERLCREIEALFRGLTRRERHPGLEQLFERVMGLYGGPFLPTDTDQRWTTWMREYLRNRFLWMLMKAGNYWEERTLWEKATEWYWRGLHVDNLAEQIYQRLMVCYHEQGQRSEAVRMYRQCRSVLADTLDLAPSEKTEKLYKSILHP